MVFWFIKNPREAKHNPDDRREISNKNDKEKARNKRMEKHTASLLGIIHYIDKV